MHFLETIQSYVDSIESKKFYYYIIAFLGTVVLIFGLSLFFYYRQIHFLRQKIKNLNVVRSDEVLRLLETKLRVDQQRKTVDALLLQETDFKIAGYFRDVLIKLGIKDKETAEETIVSEREDNYRETELSAKFDDMNMKEVTELLQEIEQKSRISTKRLDIIKSKKNPRTVEVHIIITTLLPKTIEGT